MITNTERQRRKKRVPERRLVLRRRLVFSEATCDHPIVRLSRVSGSNQQPIKSLVSPPACRGAKTKYINLREQISSVTLIHSATLLSLFGRLQANFLTLEKKTNPPPQKKGGLCQRLTRFCILQVLLVFVHRKTFFSFPPATQES